ncbi:MAG TPA: SUMF1/EgtB/PvdO family nonheme iron enzyme [Cyclobacteriaceae bacterium]|nr:SUMF1/EgtB/PvdO family nonheme iron enzyme [Cyclobacteriaceae bacterium]
MRILLIFILLVSAIDLAGQKKDFKVLAYVIHERTDFVKEAGVFFNDLADRNNFTFDVTKNLTDSLLVNYQVVMFLGEGPFIKSERKAFERFMEKGGGWIGFHEAWQYEKGDSWPWFHGFFGTTGYLHCRPALPARIIFDDNAHPVTQNLPQYISTPPNEWIQWQPSPRENKNIKVLASLDASNYPLGIKSILKGGDTPIVWTNTKYNMIYLGVGYDARSLSDRLQNQLIKDALMWVGKKSVAKGREAIAAGTDLPEMIKVQGGKFMMGDDAGDKDEKPAREVSVSDFSIAKTEVTRGQWRNFCLSTGRKMPEDPWFRQSEQHPVVNVSWDHAMAYCLWLSDVTGKHYRLPSEAEWEFAARGGLKSKGFPYSGGKNADSVAWLGRKTEGTMPVAQKAPNELGLYDMTGNVWEWTSDWYDASKQFYVFRGGAWDIGARNNRIAYRNPLAPMSRNHNKGFRVVCD